MSLPASAMKRKADDLEDEDEEEPMLGRQVLPVANLPDTFDGVPMDGMQYLFTVRRDARLLPHITRVANPYEVPDPQLPEAIPMHSAGATGELRRGNLLPSEEWRETFLRRFKNFRKNSVQPTIHVHIPDSSAKPMPDKKERDFWWAFLSGRPESEWNPPKKSKQPKPSRWQQRTQKQQQTNLQDAQDISLPYDVGEPGGADTAPEIGGLSSHISPLPVGQISQPGIEAHGTYHQSQYATLDHPTDTMSVTEESFEVPLTYWPREPTPALLQHIDHRYAIHLLMYFGYWINLRVEEGHLPHTEFTDAHGRWMFTLLSRVDDWISGDETSMLRTLARGCMQLIIERRKHPVAKESPQESPMIDETSCWMVITAIIGVWGQTDLWMDAESMLSKVESPPI